MVAHVSAQAPGFARLTTSNQAVTVPLVAGVIVLVVHAPA